MVGFADLEVIDVESERREATISSRSTPAKSEKMQVPSFTH
jgi:hypothetical protein